MKRILLNLFGCISILLIFSKSFQITASSQIQPQNAKITVVDHLDRTVVVLKNPQSIVSLHPIATQIIYILNAQDKLVAFDNFSKENEWVHKIDPDWASRKVLSLGDAPPSIETIAAIKPEIVIQRAFFPNHVALVAKVANVVAFDFHLRTPVEIVDLIGKAIGKEKRAQDLITYINKKTNYITNITNKIPRKNRPAVLCGSFLSVSGGIRTCGNKSYQHRVIEKAGGINLGEIFPITSQTINTEMLLKWDPSFMFMNSVMQGRNITLKDMENNPILSSLNIMETKHYYFVPYGLSSSMIDSPEGIIGLLFIAKKLHPDKFTNLNLENEVKEFYARWYRYHLSDEEVNQILNP